MIEQIPVYVLLFFLSILFHESMHSFESYRQSKINNDIMIDWKNWTMRQFPEGQIKNWDLVSLSGGIYSSIVWFITSMLSTGLLQFASFSFGWMQLLYGLYEWKFEYTNSKLERIGLYILGFIITLLVVK